MGFIKLNYITQLFRYRSAQSSVGYCNQLPQIELIEIWDTLHNTYFPHHSDLANYTVRWSNRKQKRSLGCCNNCLKRITIARPLSLPRYKDMLESVLFHEMCHAVQGELKIINGRRKIHGHDFKLLESKHPGTSELNKWIKNGGWNVAKQLYSRLHNSNRLT